MKKNTLECLLYQSPQVLKNLHEMGVADDGATLVVEVSAASVLAPVFDQQAKLRFGIAGLLGDSGRIGRLARNYSGLENPVILGSRPAVSVFSTQGALTLLRNLNIPYERIVLLLHLSEMERFAYALQMCERFAVLLYRNDPVPFTLPKAASILAQLEVLTPESWGGLILSDTMLEAEASPGSDEFESIERDFSRLVVRPDESSKEQAE